MDIKKYIFDIPPHNIRDFTERNRNLFKNIFRLYSTMDRPNIPTQL